MCDVQVSKILPRTNSSALNLDHVLGTDNGKWHEAAELSVLFYRIFIVFLDVVWEVVTAWSSAKFNHPVSVVAHTQEFGSAQCPP